jgi:hypothetical protein
MYADGDAYPIYQWPPSDPRPVSDPALIQPYDVLQNSGAYHGLIIRLFVLLVNFTHVLWHVFRRCTSCLALRGAEDVEIASVIGYFVGWIGWRYYEPSTLLCRLAFSIMCKPFFLLNRSSCTLNSNVGLFQSSALTRFYDGSSCCIVSGTNFVSEL